ncbi:SWI/SNF complex subunit SMARCC1-like isoform X2 [Sycon ciliatum]|uniref:SWI/SNF complex subunit SMARCC1-like isoform X2 n=1 Tax=Sycon ciliatum TaxID=27933 RepID=UPI0031F6DDA7
MYIQSDSPNSKTLASLVYSILLFQEETLGRAASNTPLIKIPVKLFLDYSEGGSLCHILLAAYKTKASQSWRRFDFQSPSRGDANLELLLNIQRGLTQNQLWTPPRVFFEKGFNKDTLATLRGILERSEGVEVDASEDASHVIVSANVPNTVGDWYRPIEKRGSEVLVHWWYYPDSYNTWLPGSNEVPDRQPKHSGVWTVTSNWLLDMEQFNEWMNEEDYAVDSSGKTTQSSSSALIAKNRKSSRGESLDASLETQSSSRKSKSGKKRRNESPDPEPTTPRRKKTRTASSTATVPPSPSTATPTSSKRKSKIEVPEEEDLTKGMPDPDPVQKLTPVHIPVTTGRPSSEMAPIRGAQLEDISDYTPKALPEPPVEKPSSPSPAASKTASDTAASSQQSRAESDRTAESPMDTAETDAPAAADDESGKAAAKSDDGPEDVASNASAAEKEGEGGEEDGDGDDDDEKPSDEQSAEDLVVEQTHHLVVPSYAAWFDYHSIHAIERRALPEFFSSKNKSKTPEMYYAYRNFMVDTHRLNPSEYLTATACRRNLSGDVCAIIRVHGFLEQWGLINYSVNIDARPSAMGPPPTSHFMLLADTQPGLQPLQIGTKPTSAMQQVLDLPNSSSAGDNATAAAATGGSDSGKAPSVQAFGLRTDVFGKKDGRTRPSSKPWTPKETQDLLAALEEHKDDWNKVAERVGTRTQDECILHFLQLPIEDPYLDEDTKLVGGLSAHQPIPFSQSGNPIMSTVAFLASVVDPRVASAAAKAALAEFSHMKDEVDTEKKAAGAASATAKSSSNENGEETGPSSEEREAAEAQLKAAEEKLNNAHADEATIATASAAALAASAVKAKQLALIEERKLQQLTMVLIDLQIKKMEIKMKHFEDLERLLEEESQSLEVQRQQLLSERQLFQQQQFQATEQAASASATATPTPVTAGAACAIPVTGAAPPATSGSLLRIGSSSSQVSSAGQLQGTSPMQQLQQRSAALTQAQQHQQQQQQQQQQRQFQQQQQQKAALLSQSQQMSALGGSQSSIPPAMGMMPGAVQPQMPAVAAAAAAAVTPAGAASAAGGAAAMSQQQQQPFDPAAMQS